MMAAQKLVAPYDDDTMYPPDPFALVQPSRFSKCHHPATQMACRFQAQIVDTYEPTYRPQAQKPYDY